MLSELLALCDGNPLFCSRIPSQRPKIQQFDIFFIVSLDTVELPVIWSAMTISRCRYYEFTSSLWASPVVCALSRVIMSCCMTTPNPSEYLRWHGGSHTYDWLRANQTWRIWVNESRDSTKNDHNHNKTYVYYVRAWSTPNITRFTAHTIVKAMAND